MSQAGGGTQRRPHGQERQLSEQEAARPATGSVEKEGDSAFRSFGEPVKGGGARAKGGLPLPVQPGPPEAQDGVRGRHQGRSGKVGDGGRERSQAGPQQAVSTKLLL